MAKCDEGYLCKICGQDVESIVDSSLYLQYVIGQIDPEVLHTTPECHIRCNPTLAQFIVDERFPPVRGPGEMDKSQLDPDYVRTQEAFVTRGYHRLHELRGNSGISVLAYPLPEVIEKRNRQLSE